MLDFITVNTHSSIRIDDGAVIYCDPFKIKAAAHDADVILITHSHFDHYSPDDVKKVMKDNTVIVCPESMKNEKLPVKNAVFVKPDQTAEVCGVAIETVPAYNSMKPFHPKRNGNVGYIINSAKNGRIYIAGDTDATAECKKVKCRIALLPIGGVYTMDAKQAAALANTIKPEYVIPVHFGSVAGKPEDAKVFISKLAKGITAIEKIERFD